MSRKGRQAAVRRIFLPVLLTVLGLASLLSSCTDSQGFRTRSLLVVGDSVAAQSDKALVQLAPVGTAVSVDAIQAGTAPCDWNHGFTDPTDNQFQSFAKVLDEVRPAVVALSLREPRSVRTGSWLRGREQTI